MTKKNFKMRNVATMVALFAVTMVFASCEKDDDPAPDTGDVDGINMSDKDYYGDNQNALQIALRNVRLKWVIKDGMIDNATGELSPDEYGEAMVCKGRQWSKGHYNDYRDDPVFREQWYAYDADGILRGYNFIKNEKYAVDWYTTPPTPFEISTGSYPYAPQWIMLAQYYEADSKDDFWDAPYTEYAGGYKISTTTVTKVDKAATIAGRLCNMYTVTTTLFLANGNSMDFIVRKAWYDPETNVTMRVEEYDSVYGLRYTAEISEIEYGKVTVAQLDKILDDYLKTRNPTDVSDDENPGWDW
jgi:hypothetical protein